MQSKIKHSGVITNIDKDTIFVELISESACAGCHAKTLCGIDSQKKTIEVKNDNTYLFAIGENINVILRESLGLKAVFLGYFLPFLVLVFTLILCLQSEISEIISASLSISILAIYYVILYLFKDRFKKEFYFEIEKCND